MTSLNLLKIATAVAFGVPSLVAQAEEVTVDGLIYNIENGVASVGVNYTPPSDLVIPSKITYEGTEYPVKSIGDNAFNCASVNSVVISEGIESIGENAFQFCMSPTYELPSSLKKIGMNGFNGCSVTNLVLPEGLEEVGDYAFANCYSMTSAVIPGTLKKLSYNMMNYCTELTDLTLSEGVEEIGEAALSGLSKLEEVKFPSSLKRIGDYAFQFHGILNLTIPSTVEYLGAGAFEFFSSMSGAYCMESITIEDGDTLLETAPEGDFAFMYVPVKKIYQGRQISPIGEFDNTTLEELEFGPKCKRIDGFAYVSNLKSLKINDGVETIGSGALTGIMSCPKIIIPASVTKIESLALSDCITLEELTLEDSDTPLELGAEAMKGTDDAKKTYIGRQLTGEKPIFARFSLDLTFGGGCKSVGGWGAVLAPDMTFLESVETIEENAFEGSETIERITMKNVKSIGAYAFDGNIRTTKIEFAPTLTSIGEYAFRGAEEKLRSVTLPESLEKMGEGVFAGCEVLSTCTLSPKLTEIPAMTFDGCLELSRITIPASVTTIGSKAFGHADKIMNVICEGATPAALAEDAFTQTVYDRAELNVPAGTRRTYGDADGWKNFANIVSDSFIITITCGEGGHAEVDGKKTAQLTVSKESQPVITIMPDEGYEIATVTVDGEAMTPAADNTITLAPVTEDMNVEITFNKKSGLDNIVSEAVSVSINGRALTVGGEGRITVCTIDGRTVYSGDCHSVELPAGGMYIVTNGETSVKVVAE